MDEQEVPDESPPAYDDDTFLLGSTWNPYSPPPPYLPPETQQFTPPNGQTTTQYGPPPPGLFYSYVGPPQQPIQQLHQQQQVGLIQPFNAQSCQNGNVE